MGIGDWAQSPIPNNKNLNNLFNIKYIVLNLKNIN